VEGIVVLVTKDNNIGDTDHSFTEHSEDITAINAEDILLDTETEHLTV